MPEARDIRDYYDAVAADYDVKHGVSLAGQAYNFATYYVPFLDAVIPSVNPLAHDMILLLFFLSLFFSSFLFYLYH